MRVIASLHAVIYFFIFCGQVDVYSFGVLLCEMSIREFPDRDRREQQVATVANNVLRALIRGCLETDPQVRPTMEEIISEIEPEAQGTF